ncbi:MAG: dTDP-4-amino-4,6-dideoxygalactose transaminase [Desulfomonilaceae bacterium]
MISGFRAKVPFNKPFIAGNELSYIRQAVMKNGQTSGGGDFTQKCQAWLVKTLGSNAALLTHSCTAALEMSAILCDLQAGDEVIMPSFTFVSTANAFALRGATPVFVDIRADTLNLDESLIQAAITSKTKAIVPVHYGGVACAMDEIIQIALEHDLFVIEDAAQALLSTYKGKYLGTLGHIGCLSFHETKNVISGEGGAILLNETLERSLASKAHIIWQKGTNRLDFFQGTTDKYTWLQLGSSFLPSEIAAAFLLAQFEFAHNIMEKRRRLVELYNNKLRPLEDLGLIQLPGYLDKGSNSNGHLFYILTSSFRERSRLINFLARHGIVAVFHYVPLHSSPAGKRYARASGSLPITNDISSRLLRLPLYYEMEPKDVELVTKAIKKFYGAEHP